jgi:hypothetical protein
MVVVALAVGWRLDSVQHRTLVEQHKALRVVLDGTITVVNEDGSLRITEPAPGELHVENGPLHK